MTPQCVEEQKEACRSQFGDLGGASTFTCDGMCGLCDLCTTPQAADVPQCATYCTFGVAKCTQLCETGKAICLACGVYWMIWIWCE